jgi:hypothetical protein
MPADKHEEDFMTTTPAPRAAGATVANWTAKRMLIASSALAAAVALWSAAAPAQQQQGQQGAQQQQQGPQGAARQGSADQNSPNMLVLIIPDVELRLPPEQRARPVSAEALYKGVRASRLMDQDVYGPTATRSGRCRTSSSTPTAR